MGFNSGFKGLMKLHSTGAEFFHADGRTDGRTRDRQTDKMKLIVAFRNFANAPKSTVVTLCTNRCNIKQFYVLPPQCIQSTVLESQEKQRYFFYPYSTNCPVFVTETEWVYCAVRATSFCTIPLTFLSLLRGAPKSCAVLSAQCIYVWCDILYCTIVQYSIVQCVCVYIYIYSYAILYIYTLYYTILYYTIL